MHNHSNDNYINFKNRINDPGLAFDGGWRWALLDFGLGLALQRRGARLR
jgi:hypothetical protein